jgi:hypothetical protein
MSAASLANMYAAYFPYYMNQFPGANPYGNSAPGAAGYGHQPFAPLNKYPMYPAAGGAPPANQTQQQQGAPKPAGASPAGGIYGGYNPYGQQQTQQQQMDDNSMSAGQDAYNKYQAFLGANQSGANKSSDFKV